MTRFSTYWFSLMLLSFAWGLSSMPALAHADSSPLAHTESMQCSPDSCCCDQMEEQSLPTCEMSCRQLTLVNTVAQEAFQLKIKISPPLVEYTPPVVKRPRPRSFKLVQRVLGWRLPKPPPIASRNIDLPPPTALLQ